ncbi:UNVERIFIED_ORG: BrnA antitoxin of type II toxin-antitoxin system [Zoogloea ramigera]|uniref:BrnA antitoxin family protein n=1 Tax=Duganella zoogloeoides TaxID=75659 RepID=A0ABZ0Y139_9BURK|nr:BrnA antitoxin family protein [Duganella zoogloeoides]WQH05743.1 BrnA antitoxin family protein [Duganella zoogloeoides]
MRNDYDFTEGKRGAVVPASGKSRITIMLDDDVLAFFREQAEAQGIGYQTLINAELRKAMQPPKSSPLTVASLRKVLKEELAALRTITA